MRNLLFSSSVALLGLVAFLFSVGYVGANPVGPVVTGGAHPWLDFTGQMSPFASETVYTVPADRVFVLTGLCSRDTSFDGLRMDVYEGGTLKIDGGSGVMNCSSVNVAPLLGTGNGRITFQPGSDLVLQYWPNSVSDPDNYYYLEGYLARP